MWSVDLPIFASHSPLTTYESVRTHDTELLATSCRVIAWDASGIRVAFKSALNVSNNSSSGLLHHIIDLQRCSRTHIQMTKEAIGGECVPYVLFRLTFYYRVFTSSFIQNSRKCILHDAFLWAVSCVWWARMYACMCDECVVAGALPEQFCCRCAGYSSLELSENIYIVCTHWHAHTHWVMSGDDFSYIRSIEPICAQPSSETTFCTL